MLVKFWSVYLTHTTNQNNNSAQSENHFMNSFKYA